MRMLLDPRLRIRAEPIGLFSTVFRLSNTTTGERIAQVAMARFGFHADFRMAGVHHEVSRDGWLPIAYVMALLFTLGTYSIYPFMIIWKSISLKLALILYLAVAAVGTVALYLRHGRGQHRGGSQGDRRVDHPPAEDEPSGERTSGRS